MSSSDRHASSSAEKFLANQTSDASLTPKSIFFKDHAHTTPEIDNSFERVLILSSFLSPQPIPFRLLLRAASRRSRWTTKGDVIEVNPGDVGFDAPLPALFSNRSKLLDIVHRLPGVRVDALNDSYRVDEETLFRLLQEQSPEQCFRWKYCALIVACRSIPWKYLEPVSFDPSSFFPHIKHTLQACAKELPYLSKHTRIEVGLSLVEASRFPGMEWKRFAMSQAKIVSTGVHDAWLDSRVAHAECLLNRIDGSMLLAAARLAAVQTRDSNSSSITTEMNHCIAGQEAIQRALNFIQIEALSAAEEVLNAWCPLNEIASPMEKTILFKKGMLLGKLLRFSGRFQESLDHLEAVQRLAEQPGSIVFDEDLRDFTCDLADTLRELDRPMSAEMVLRAELRRRTSSYIPKSGRSLLELSLAEALFAQRFYAEGETLCLSALNCSPCLKFEKLRAYIILAKIYHMTSNTDKEYSHWVLALEAVNRFHGETFATTRIILKSICDFARRTGVKGLQEQTQARMSSLAMPEEPCGMKHWISGIRHWAEYLQNSESPI
ncbi:hypothetical protein NM208_g8058 [Fusarium decemcellulare]|uniref:Uncharacterized protein n=1 Tax=Fusarium decemcellulare TaxID=57161 RepID=A0ACC1S6Y1_9HYPO|nr:hypothetical protein NM208_g8058 [Fusarium decemcellulare]